MINVTFTGIDNHTDYHLLNSTPYNVEYGVLFSETKAGDNIRYPSLSRINYFLHNIKTSLSAHLCGAYARYFIEGCPEKLELLPLDTFNRIQLNVSPYITDIKIENILYSIDSICKKHHELIIQSSFKNIQESIKLVKKLKQNCNINLSILQDSSGGQGIVLNKIHTDSETKIGYAGGINPDNIEDIISIIPIKNTWIDMETGVRTNNIFDFNKVYLCLQKLNIID